MRITSSEMLVLCLAALAGGFVWATFYPAAPYGVLAPSVVGIAGAYWAKRTLQKSEKYGAVQPVGQKRQVWPVPPVITPVVPVVPAESCPVTPEDYRGD